MLQGANVYHVNKGGGGPAQAPVVGRVRSSSAPPGTAEIGGRGGLGGFSVASPVRTSLSRMIGLSCTVMMGLAGFYVCDDGL